LVSLYSTIKMTHGPVNIRLSLLFSPHDVKINKSAFSPPRVVTSLVQFCDKKKKGLLPFTDLTVAFCHKGAVN